MIDDYYVRLLWNFVCDDCNTYTSVFAFYNSPLMLATYRKEFFIKKETLSLLMRIIICFLNGPLVVILIQGFGLFWPLTILLTWLIFSAFSKRNVFLIFKTLEVLNEGLTLEHCFRPKALWVENIWIWHWFSSWI